MDTAEELIRKLNEMEGGVIDYWQFTIRALLLIATKLEIIAANSAKR